MLVSKVSIKTSFYMYLTEFIKQNTALKKQKLAHVITDWYNELGDFF